MNTSFKEALNALDKINTTTLVESAHTDELLKLTQETAQLEKEIKELEDQKRKGWSDKYDVKLDADWRKLRELEDELKKLRNSYTHYIYDDDGHKDDSWEDEKKKAEVAEQEEDLYNRLQEVRAAYDKLRDALRQEHEAEFEPQTKELKTKYATVKDNKTKKETVMKAIFEEERPELEAICNKINKGIKLVTPIWKTFTADKRFWKPSEADDHRLYIELEGEPFDVEITDDDWDVEVYAKDAYFNEDKVLNAVAEDMLLDGNEGFDEILEALDIDWDELNTAIRNKTPFSIPGHSWLFDTDIQVKLVGDEPRVYSLWYDPGDYWNPPDGEFTYDETITVKPIYTLVKIITPDEEEKLAEGNEEKSLTEATDSLKESPSDVDSVRVMAWCTRHCVDFFEAVAENAPKTEQRKLNKEAYKAMKEKFGLTGKEADDLMCKGYALWKRLYK